MQSLIRSKSAGVTGGRGTAGAGPGRDLLETYQKGIIVSHYTTGALLAVLAPAVPVPSCAWLGWGALVTPPAPVACSRPWGGGVPGVG